MISTIPKPSTPLNPQGRRGHVLALARARAAWLEIQSHIARGGVVVFYTHTQGMRFNSSNVDLLELRGAHIIRRLRRGSESLVQFTGSTLCSARGCAVKFYSRKGQS